MVPAGLGVMENGSMIIGPDQPSSCSVGSFRAPSPRAAGPNPTLGLGVDHAGAELDGRKVTRPDAAWAHDERLSTKLKSSLIRSRHH